MRALIVAALLLTPPAALATESPEYIAVRSARPDGRTVEVRDFSVTRDAYTFRFTGTFHFLAPFEGRTFGAVFIGSGTYELRPVSDTERRHLALITNDQSLEIFGDSFERMVLLFADKTAGEIEKGGTLKTGGPDAKAVEYYQSYMEDQRTRYQINLHLRVLQDLLNGTQPGVFLAPVDGKKHPPALIVVDSLGISALAARFSDISGEEVAFISADRFNGGFWYLANAQGKGNPNEGSAPRILVDPIHYAIDTTIDSNLTIKATTTMRFATKDAPVRVLPLHILPKLRLRRATLKTNGVSSDAAIVQEEIELGRIARLFHNEVADADAAVVFASMLPARSEAELTLEYEGREVLYEVGFSSYSVRARESWYPNPGAFLDTATFDLTFRFPKKNTLVATGKLASEKSDDRQTVSEWKSEGPMRVAGFNYGHFEKLTRTDPTSGAVIDVYTDRDHEKFAGDTAVDAINTARVAAVFFGKTPYSPVSVTQQIESSFGQSWPSLIYLPTIALTNSTQRMMMADGSPALFGLNEFAKMVGWHEFAHQWWGHAVGWQSYRDQWLSEGFAEFSAALVLQFTESWDKYQEFLERRRRTILQKPARSLVTSNDAAPITMGFRAATMHSPAAGQALVYFKGGYVLHMLRMMMRNNSAANPDERFIAMMKDFVDSYSGGSPSSRDFQKVVERHMVPTMNAAGDGKMNWFFDQWVYGTNVPRIKNDLKLEAKAGGKYQMSGTVVQEEVPADFRTVVPIYVDFGGNTMAVIGAIRLIGTTPLKVNAEIGLPKQPKRIVVNAMHDVLVRD